MEYLLSCWYVVLYVITLTHQTVAQVSDFNLDELCKNRPPHHVTPHPRDCSAYVECFNGFPSIRKCGPSLHYNPAKRVCDYPKEAGCIYKQGPRPRPGFGRPGRGPRLRPNTLVSPRPTYEETVYGNNGGKAGVLPNPFRGFRRSVMREAMGLVQRRMKREIQLYKDMYGVVDSAPYQMASKFLNARPYVKKISQSGMALLYAMKIMKKRFHLHGNIAKAMISMYDMGDMLKPMPGPSSPTSSLPIMPDIDYCPYPDVNCDPSNPYRTADGSCNNLHRPILGRSLTPFRRLVPPVYDDGIESARRSVSGHPLPGARHVSKRLFPDADLPQQQFNMMMVFWGQLIDHDLTLTAITEIPVDGSLDDTQQVKCGFDGCQTDGPGLESCWPIPVPDDDSDFPFNRCLKFVRAAEVPALDCQLGPRQQLNQATHWMDGSMIYGTTDEDSRKLRDLEDTHRGRMLTRSHPESHSFRGLGPVLPSVEDNECRDVNNTHSCFLAGDERVNENTGLTVYHTALIREHNRIEDILHHLNPHWSGERLYQETRKILVAMCQHITFNEWLPLIVGPDAVKRYDLEIMSSGFDYGYTPSLDSRILNEFATAAFRFGHTLLEERMRRADVNYNYDDSLFLSDTLFRPSHAYDVHHGGLDAFARGLSNLPCQSYDQFFTKQVTKSLFSERPPFGPGMDLLSLNIQRGRDHGLGTYNDFREVCGLGRAKTFDDLSKEVSDPRALDSLKFMYSHVDDIDLFPGGISEKSVPGGQVGPTFSCLISETFSKLKKGDRFWFERGSVEGFTPDQLQEIRKATISRMLCTNLDTLSTIQRWLFMMPTEPNTVLDQIPHGFRRFFDNMSDFLGPRGNPRVPCETLPEMDLSHWKETPIHY